MSEIKFSCPGCGQHIACDTSYGGRQINCPVCQAAMVVPGEPPAPTPAPTGLRASSTACPGCGAGVPLGAVLCTHCGFNLRTGQRIRPELATSTPASPAPSRGGGSSWAGNSNVWIGVGLAIFAVLFVMGLSNEKAAIAYHGVTGLFSLAVGIMVLVSAFQESAGQGFMTLCIPFYALYFVFGRSESPLLKALVAVSILTRVAGLMVKMQT